MKPVVAPRCRNCGDKKPPAGTFFCTNKCARIWAEELLLGSDEGWCGACREWGTVDPQSENQGCGRCQAPLQYPQREYHRYG